MADMSKMTDPKWLSFVALIILLVSGINTGVYGLIHVDIIGSIIGGLLERLFYIIVGVSAGYLIYLKVTKQSVA